MDHSECIHKRVDYLRLRRAVTLIPDAHVDSADRSLAGHWRSWSPEQAGEVTHHRGRDAHVFQPICRQRTGHGHLGKSPSVRLPVVQLCRGGFPSGPTGSAEDYSCVDHQGRTQRHQEPGALEVRSPRRAPDDCLAVKQNTRATIVTPP